MNYSLWQTCLLSLKKIIPQKQFIKYINTIQLNINKHTYTLLIPNNHIKEKIIKNYLLLIKNIIKNKSQNKYKINFKIGNIIINKKNINNKKTYNKQLTNKKITKIPVKTNQIKTILKLITNNLGILYNPIICCKKIHIIKKLKKFKIIITEPQKLTKEIKNIKKKLNKNYNILIINHIEEIYENRTTKNNIINIINVLKNKKIQIIITIKNLSQEQNNIYKNLKLLSGLIIQTNNPNLKSRIKTLNEKAKKLNIKINNNIIKFIAKKIKENKKSLETIIKYMIAKSKNQKTIIKLNPAKTIIYQHIKKKYISIKKIIKIVMKHYDINYDIIKSKNKNKSIVQIRQIIFYLCKKFTKNSLSEIGNCLGKYAHTTVLYSYNKIKNKRNLKNKINYEINTLIKKITK